MHQEDFHELYALSVSIVAEMWASQIRWRLPLLRIYTHNCVRDYPPPHGAPESGELWPTATLSPDDRQLVK